MMILALVLLIGGAFVRSWVSRTVAEKYSDEWLSEKEFELNTMFLNGKDFRKFRAARLKTDRRLYWLNKLGDFLIIAGIAVMILTPMVQTVRHAASGIPAAAPAPSGVAVPAIQ